MSAEGRGAVGDSVFIVVVGVKEGIKSYMPSLSWRRDSYGVEWSGFCYVYYSVGLVWVGSLGG